MKWACGVTGVVLWGQGRAVHVGTRVLQRRCISGESPDEKADEGAGGTPGKRIARWGDTICRIKKAEMERFGDNQSK